jgi:hypothetical protein
MHPIDATTRSNYGGGRGGGGHYGPSGGGGGGGGCYRGRGGGGYRGWAVEAASRWRWSAADGMVALTATSPTAEDVARRRWWWSRCPKSLGADQQRQDPNQTLAEPDPTHMLNAVGSARGVTQPQQHSRCPVAKE